MKTERHVSSTGSMNACGACQQLNPPDAKFCSGCGQSLQEPCPECNTPVFLSQQFCASCGCDLGARLKKMQAELNQLMAQAIEDAKRSDYFNAINTLNRIVREDDYRLREITSRAQQVLDRVTKLRDEGTASADSVLEQARTAYENRNPEAAIRLLEQIPASLLPDEGKHILRESRGFVEQVTALNTELQSAVKAKDWRLLGSLVGQLLTLVPDNENYQQIAGKVTSKLFDLANRQVAASDYDGAHEFMQSVPEFSRKEEHDLLLAKIETFRWYRRQLENEPFATPTLGKLAVRFAKESKDETVPPIVKELAQAVKSKTKPRHAFNDWKGTNQCWIGGRFGILGRSQLLKCDEAHQKTLAKQSHSLTVAIGLALQAVGRTRVKECLYQPKKGLLGALSRQKPTIAWGIDIGTTSIRAVLLEVFKEKEKDAVETITVKDIYIKAFDSPLCRADVVKPDEIVKKAIEQFVDQKSESLEETPAWVNLSAKEIVHRYVQLPPLKDKEALKMFEAEIDHQIPLELSDLSIVRWASQFEGEDVVVGRPAIVAASRLTVVNRRVELCKDAGLELAGMQADTIAIANYAAYEFADCLEAEASDTKPPGIALVDCGVEATTIIAVTARSIWMTSCEIGGEDFTSIIARSLKKTLADADELKKNPFHLEDPGTAFDSFEPKMQQLRQRLMLGHSNSKSKDDGQVQKNSHEFTALETWCVGGNGHCLTFARKVLGKS